MENLEVNYFYLINNVALSNPNSYPLKFNTKPRYDNFIKDLIFINIIACIKMTKNFLRLPRYFDIQIFSCIFLRY